MDSPGSIPYSVPVFVPVFSFFLFLFFFLFSRSQSALHRSGLSQCSAEDDLKNSITARFFGCSNFSFFFFFFCFFLNPPSLLPRVKLERSTDKVECASDDCDIILLLASHKD